MIDGTTRAQQWRRARSQAPGEEEQARSEAPKSIAGSLLVPANLLPGADVPDEPLNPDRQSGHPTPRGELDQTAAAATSAPGADAGNPFLAPDAEQPNTARIDERPTRRLGALVVGRRVMGTINPHRRHIPRLQPLRWRLPNARRTSWIALATVSCAAIAVATVILAQSHTRDSPASQASIGPLTTRPLEPFRSRRAAATTRRSSPRHAGPVRPVHRQRRAKATPDRTPTSSPTRPLTQSRPPAPASSAVTVATHYTPAPATSTTIPSASGTSRYASSAPPVSSTSPVSSAPSTTTTHHSQPAFGASGTLGPGRGASATQ